MSLSKSNQKIKELVNNEVNSFLQLHSGFAELIAIEEETEETRVILQFFGGCSGCPLSYSSTLRHIERMLNKEFEKVNIKVINVETL